MSFLSKKSVCVLFGGRSSEHGVSIVSANAVLHNLDKEKYVIYPIGITKEGEFLLCPDIEIGDFDSFDHGELAKVSFASGKVTAEYKNGEAVSISDPVILPILHGQNGEDGRLQGLLELQNISFAGCGCEASAICFDKAATKDMLNAIGIRQAKCILVYRRELPTLDIPALDSRIKDELGGYPIFVKPSRSGSSVGVTKVKSADGLSAALGEAAREDGKIMLEEYIRGYETEIAVLESEGELKVSYPARILPGAEFYDYEAKYNSEASSYIIPAPIGEACTERIRALASSIFRHLGCRGLSRIDFFVDGDVIVFNEINTLPGFTPISMYPKLMMHSGYTYSGLLDAIIDEASR